MTFIREF